MINGMKIIDFHSHILPGADHGSSGLQMTSEQLALMEKSGVDTVVATPHFYPNLHTVEQFEATVSRCVEDIWSLELPRPRICIGAEVLYYEGMERMENIDRLCIKGTDILLFELPLAHWDMEVFDTVRRLARKYTLVLAHIDRYISDHEEEIELLIDSGALAQINVSSLYSFSVKKKIMPYIKDGRVCAIGSDLHEVDKKAYKHFAEAYKKLGDDYAAIMERSRELLKNAEKI